MLKHCPACGTEHNLYPTMTPDGNTVGYFCPVVRDVVEVTSYQWDDVDAWTSIGGFIVRRVNIEAARRMEPDALKRLAHRMASLYVRTPFARSRDMSFLWVRAVAVRVLEKITGRTKAA